MGGTQAVFWHRKVTSRHWRNGTLKLFPRRPITEQLCQSTQRPTDARLPATAIKTPSGSDPFLTPSPERQEQLSAISDPQQRNNNNNGTDSGIIRAFGMERWGREGMRDCNGRVLAQTPLAIVFVICTSCLSWDSFLDPVDCGGPGHLLEFPSTPTHSCPQQC